MIDFVSTDREATGAGVDEAQNRYAVPDKFKNFPIYAWGFTIGPTIAKLYAEWQG
jgi:hypothetical protein